MLCVCVVYYVLSICVVLVIMRLIWAKLSWVESEWLAVLQKTTLELEAGRRLLCVYSDYTLYTYFCVEMYGCLSTSTISIKVILN